MPEVISAVEAGDVLSTGLERSRALLGVVRASGELRFASAGLLAMIGREPGRSEWNAIVAEGMAALDAAAGEARVEGRLSSADDGVRAIRFDFAPLDPDSGDVLVIGHDVTADRERESRLGERAVTDGLTGLPNRLLLTDRIGQALLVSERQRDSLAVIVLDLDRFKDVNDTYGHRTGDTLLTQVGARIRSVLRESDTVARIGGDEFAILLPPPADAVSAHATARKVYEALVAPFEISGAWIETRASLGIALSPEHSRSVDDLLERADTAMYLAKRARTHQAIYDAEHDLRSPALLERVGALHDAIEGTGLSLHFQPALRLIDEEVVRAEALVRWHHPTLGWLRPAAFVPLAERNGLSLALTRWVLSHALERCRDWRAAGARVGVAVNVSMRDLLDPTLPAIVARELAAREIQPSALTLEVSERALPPNADRLSRPLAELSRTGIRIALDDFGSGAASLRLLQRLRFNEIKLDQRLVANVLTDRDSWSLVRSGIDAARDLGIESAAEGVEDPDTRAILGRLSCDLAQGHYFASSAARRSFSFLQPSEIESARPA